MASTVQREIPPAAPVIRYDILDLTMEEYQTIRNSLHAAVDGKTFRGNNTYRTSTDPRTESQIAADLIRSAVPFKNKGWN